GSAERVATIVKVRVASTASTLPAVSVARATKVCAPVPRSEYSEGDLHAVNAASSSLHSNVAGSVAEKTNPATVSLVSSYGPASIDTCGATVSTVNEWL